VIVQTLQPDHLAIQAAIRHDYDSFVRVELGQRRELGYPPFGRLSRLLVSHPEADKAEQAARRLRTRLEEASLDDGATILGPAPCPILRVRGRARWQIIVKTADEQVQDRLVERSREWTTSSSRLRITLDVDPSALL